MELRTFEAHSLGHVFEDTDITAFFGNQNSSLDQLSLFFPDFKFVLLKQIHSDIAVVSRAETKDPAPNAPAGAVVAPAEQGAGIVERKLIEADAHITLDRHLAIAVRTADCIPVLIHDADSGWIASIHAGWRGVETEIIKKTGELLKHHGATLKSARAFIGPHIMKESFEVGLDVAEKLQARFETVQSYSEKSSCIEEHEDSSKKYVDLACIARAQLASIGIDRERTRELAIDTFRSQDHESFRRDKTSGGRQISFIALK